MPDLIPDRTAVRFSRSAVNALKLSVGLQLSCLDDGLSGFHGTDLHQFQPHLAHGVQHRLTRMGEDYPLHAVVLEEADDTSVMLAVVALVMEHIPADLV